MHISNFGAFLAFVGVNLATFWQFGVVGRPGYRRSLLVDIVLPLIDFAFCALILWNLNPLAKTAGGIWFAIGLLYVVIKTRGFRAVPVMILASLAWDSSRLFPARISLSRL